MAYDEHDDEKHRRPECKSECVALATLAGEVRAMHEKIVGEINALDGTVKALADEIWNHGRDGLKSIVIKNIERQEGIREERERRESKDREAAAIERTTDREERERIDRKITHRQNWLLVFVGIIGLVVAVLTYLSAKQSESKGLIHLPGLISADSHESYSAKLNQNQLSSR
jgi:hypothetical protein